MKTKEELNALKEEVEELNKKLVQLNDDELKQVSGGGGMYLTLMHCDSCEHEGYWSGRFLHKIFDCPICGEHSFSGIEQVYVNGAPGT